MGRSSYHESIPFFRAIFPALSPHALLPPKKYRRRRSSRPKMDENRPRRNANGKPTATRETKETTRAKSNQSPKTQCYTFFPLVFIRHQHVLSTSSYWDGCYEIVRGKARPCHHRVWLIHVLIGTVGSWVTMKSPLWMTICRNFMFAFLVQKIVRGVFSLVYTCKVYCLPWCNAGNMEWTNLMYLLCHSAIWRWCVEGPCGITGSISIQITIHWFHEQSVPPQYRWIVRDMHLLDIGHSLDEDFLRRSGSVCLDVINQTWSPMFGLLPFTSTQDTRLNLALLDMINIFEVFIPQLMRYPNPTDPLNGEAAALLMREPSSYDAKVRGKCLWHLSLWSM